MKKKTTKKITKQELIFLKNKSEFIHSFCKLGRFRNCDYVSEIVYLTKGVSKFTKKFVKKMATGESFWSKFICNVDRFRAVEKYLIL
jgi:hypothetical protein